jgi:hypothetical protein
VWINLAPFNVRGACYGRWPEFLLKVITRALFKLKWMSYQSPCCWPQKSTKDKKCGAELKEFHSWIHCMMCSTAWCYAWWFDKLALLSNMPFGGEIMTDSLRRCLTIIQSEHFPLFWHWPYLIFKWGLTSICFQTCAIKIDILNEKSPLNYLYCWIKNKIYEKIVIFSIYQNMTCFMQPAWHTSCASSITFSCHNVQ